MPWISETAAFTVARMPPVPWMRSFPASSRCRVQERSVWGHPAAKPQHQAERVKLRVTSTAAARARATTVAIAEDHGAPAAVRQRHHAVSVRQAGPAPRFPELVRDPGGPGGEQLTEVRTPM